MCEGRKGKPMCDRLLWVLYVIGGFGYLALIIGVAIYQCTH